MHPEIEAELVKVRDRFETWARRRRLLKQGEALSVSFTIASAAAVVTPTPLVNPVLDMPISEFFSDDRIRKAGLDPKGIGTRLRNLQGREPRYGGGSALGTVRDLQQIGLGRFGKGDFRQSGAVTADAIRQVFRFEGITWKD